MKHLALFYIFILFASYVRADEPAVSNKNIWAENQDIYVLHSHSVGGSVDYSFIKLVSKQTGHVVKQFETTPFMELISIEGGKYFVGLSDLLADSQQHGYNFALINSNGEFISRVFVSARSGHCEKVSQSVSQYVSWYSPNIIVSLVKKGDAVTSIKVNPYTYNDKRKPCVLPVGDHLYPETECIDMEVISGKVFKVNTCNGETEQYFPKAGTIKK